MKPAVIWFSGGGQFIEGTKEVGSFKRRKGSSQPEPGGRLVFFIKWGSARGGGKKKRRVECFDAIMLKSLFVPVTLGRMNECLYGGTLEGTLVSNGKKGSKGPTFVYVCAKGKTDG